MAHAHWQMPAFTTLKLSANRLRPAIKAAFDADSEMASRVAWLAFAFLSLYWTTFLASGAALAPEMLHPGYGQALAGEVVRTTTTGGSGTAVYDSRPIAVLAPDVSRCSPDWAPVARGGHGDVG